MTCWLCGFDTKVIPPTCKNGPCRICAEVAKVDEEINQAAAALRRLVTKRYELRSEQNRAHDPMHRLPLELRNYTFGLVLPTRDEWGNIVGQDGKPITPSYLTSICTSWRDTAWSNPSFWSTIPIVLGTLSTSDPSDSWINFVRHWILRSRTLPLTIHIVAHYVDEYDVEEKLKCVLDAMSQFPNEWQSLSLEMPFNLSRDFHQHDSDFHSHLLTVKRLRVNIIMGPWADFSQPVPPSHSMSPEKIEICDLGFRSLKISWNHLTSATIEFWDLETVTQLFQHASQMTYSSIVDPRLTPDFAVPSVTHRKLQTLSLHCRDQEVMPLLLDSLTLPCLQEFCTTETNLLAASHLPALVHRSSCSLTRIRFSGGIRQALDPLRDLRPLPGVTDLAVEQVFDSGVVKQLLLEGSYFPDLRHLTLQLRFFVVLWKEGCIPMMLDPNRLDKMALRKIIVVVPDLDADVINPMWISKLRERLKGFQSSINLRQDGFEILIPEVLSRDDDS